MQREPAQMVRTTLIDRAILPFLAVAWLHCALGGDTLFAQVNVSVNAGSVVAALPSTGIGLHTSVYANQFGNAVLPGRIAESGVDMLRYPGGSYSDIYHWTNHTATDGYAASQSHFGRFVQIMDQAGTSGMVTVELRFESPVHAWAANRRRRRLGSHMRTEMPACLEQPNDITIGVDAEGNDWRTVGYWARLRTLTAAQNLDNQYDFLAIDRDLPIDIKYWEIGNELNGNGYYSDLNCQLELGNRPSRAGRCREREQSGVIADDVRHQLQRLCRRNEGCRSHDQGWGGADRTEWRRGRRRPVAELGPERPRNRRREHGFCCPPLVRAEQQQYQYGPQCDR